jgi:hypothetical protein
MSEFAASGAAESSLPEEFQEIENKLVDPSWLSEILHMTVDRAVLEDMSTAGNDFSLSIFITIMSCRRLIWCIVKKTPCDGCLR